MNPTLENGYLKDAYCPACDSKNTNWVEPKQAEEFGLDYNAECLDCGWRGDSFDLLDEA